MKNSKIITPKHYVVIQEENKIGEYEQLNYTWTTCKDDKEFDKLQVKLKKWGDNNEDKSMTFKLHVFNAYQPMIMFLVKNLFVKEVPDV